MEVSKSVITLQERMHSPVTKSVRNRKLVVNFLIFHFFLASEESYLRQLEIEEMYGAKKADEKKDKEK